MWENTDWTSRKELVGLGVDGSIILTLLLNNPDLAEGQSASQRTLYRQVL